MSNFLSSLVVEPALRRARRIHESLSDITNRPDHEVSAADGTTSDLEENDVNTGSPVSNEENQQQHPRLSPTASSPPPPSSPPQIDPGFRADGVPSIHERDQLAQESQASASSQSQDGSPDVLESPSTALNDSTTYDARMAQDRTTDELTRRRSSESIEGPIGSEDGPGELPEDDGMSPLRRKIHTIRNKKVSNAEKARLVHNLMTENYTASLKRAPSEQSIKARSGSSTSHGRPMTPLSIRSRQSVDQFSLTPASATSMSSLDNPYGLTQDDLEPTYYTRRESAAQVDEASLPTDDTGDSEGEEEDSSLRLGCQHYKRNVKLQCYTCKKWYTCRFCHDEAEDHTVIRRATENMLCMVCSTPQPASQWCKKCGVQAACYYCSVCKLWDDDSEKSIYHCNDCGICRLGQGLGKDFVHCKICSACIPVSIATTHRCIELSTKCDCPICGDYLFTSPEKVILMRCGHSIHQNCFSEHSKTSYRCPICNKTIANMEANFRNIDRAIESQPMPDSFSDMTAFITCNDCCAKSVVKYHWLGTKCDICDSYNTTQLQIMGNNGGTITWGNEDTQAHQNTTATTGLSRLIHRNLDSGALSVDGAGSASNLSRSVPADDGPLSMATTPVNQRSDVRRLSSTLPRRPIALQSPTIGNYFGTQSRGGSENLSSPTRTQHHKSDYAKSEDGNFWSTRRLRSGLSIFGDSESDTDNDEDMVEVKDDDDDDDEEDEDAEDDEDEADDEDDDDDGIDIFGHR